jgi:hypothetical protein
MIIFRYLDLVIHGYHIYPTGVEVMVIFEEQYYTVVFLHGLFMLIPFFSKASVIFFL